MGKRELKFRIWNGLEMVYDITTGKFGTFYVNPEKGDGLNPEDTASLTVNTTKYHEGTPLMQFIGLTDKNGQEIYEGDILKSNSDHLMEVCWNDRFSSFCLQRNNWMFLHYFGEAVDAKDCEVIGNIYQNPNGFAGVGGEK